MKMAKASPEDLDMAMKLANALDDITRGYFPERFIDLDGDPHGIEIPERIDTDDAAQYERLIDGLRELLRQGSIFRVIWGMAVVCDPDNECIDPDADTIEHHPMRQQLESAAHWRDVAEELPQEAQEVLFVRGGKTVHGAWIGGIFWHSNQKMAAAKWMPLPLPPNA